MKRVLKILKWIGIVLLVLIIATPIVLRVRRNSAGKPETLHGGLVMVRNVFAYVIGARVGDKVIIFDGGIDDAGGALDSLLGALGATRDQVSDVFLSHGHFDHVQHAPLCKNARIHLGIADADMAALKARHEPWAARMFARILPPPPVAVTNALLDRAEVMVGREKVLALPVPGHTPGSYVFLFRDVLIGGDTIFRDGNELDFAMGAFSVSLDESKRSVGKLGPALAGLEINQVCTGHQGCTKEGDGRRQLDNLVKKAPPIQ